MTRHLIGILILSTIMLTGCGREDSPAASDAAAARRETAAEAERTAAEVKADADKAAADARAVADKAAADVRATADKAAADAQSAADKAAADARAAADESATIATSLLAQLTQYIRDNRFDLADKALAELDGMKDSLPASLQGQIETARTSLAAKKTAAGIW